MIKKASIRDKQSKSNQAFCSGNGRVGTGCRVDVKAPGEIKMKMEKAQH